MRESYDLLKNQIYSKREEMFACASKNGFGSMETLKCSQELDRLIYAYQVLFKNRNSKETGTKEPLWSLLHLSLGAGETDQTPA